ncbi:MAG: hypothetical protein DCC67_01570, partial [Planctomycetota bacterium]
MYDRDNLIAWCIVPFDARRRRPEERAQMLRALGFKKFAYDWRSEHLPSFDQELASLKKQSIELVGVWFPAGLNDDAKTILDALKRHEVQAQLWVMMGDPPAEAASDSERAQWAARQLRPVVEAAAAQRCSVGLYNHGGWCGEPENQLAILEALNEPNVGIVYNLHHGHDHVQRLGDVLARLKDHLYAVNLNGMDRDGERRGRKILPLGQGELDLQVIKTIAGSGYDGPIGVLGHTNDDAEHTLRTNLAGLDSLVAKLGDSDPAATPFEIQVLDKQNGWPVPLIELRTTHGVRWVTDNAGRVAVDAPELMGRQSWFHVEGHGYEFPADGFGQRGVRLTPQPGDATRIEVSRTNIAKRLGRLTGAGLFAESQKLGLERDVRESGVFGCDSVQTAVYRGRLFWAWGDTSVPHYPLGLFHMTSATTPCEPLKSLEPPLRLQYEYFADDEGRPRSVAEMPGEGPTWLTGYIALPDESGGERLVATYHKIRPPLEPYELGLCAWNDEAAKFDHVATLWRKSDAAPTPPPAPQGHPVIYQDDSGEKWALFGNPLPTLRCRATSESWRNPAAWEQLSPPEHLVAAADGGRVTPHSGSIAWNGYRQRWVAVFMEAWGKPSAFG